MDVKIYGQLSFPALAKPETPPNSTRKRYSASILVDKDSKWHTDIINAMKEVGKAKWGEKFNDKMWRRITSDAKQCFYTDGELKDYSGYDGKFVAAAHTNLPAERPSCFNQRREKLGDEEIERLFYPGCYVYAIISIWAQDNQHGTAIRASLSGIQFAKDGERFSSVKVADESAFDVLEEAEDVADVL